MQFQYNSDYPDRFYNSINNQQQQQQVLSNIATTNISTATTSNTNSNTNLHNLDARDPYHFPPVEPISCTRITTRIYNPITRTISTVPNVLVKTQSPPPRGGNHNQQQQQQRRRSSTKYQPPQHRLSVQNFDLNPFPMNVQNLDDDDDDDDDENMDSSSSSSSDFSTDAGSFNNDDNDPLQENDDPNHIAYWIQNIIREAIYGRVYKAIILRKITPQQKQLILQSVTIASTSAIASIDSSVALQQEQQMIQQNNMNMIQNVEWEITSYDCAIKEMSWQHIRKERDRLAEDPVKEVCAMQYFKNWYNNNNTNTMTTTTSNNSSHSTSNQSPPTIAINQQQQQQMITPTTLASNHHIPSNIVTIQNTTNSITSHPMMAPFLTTTTTTTTTTNITADSNRNSNTNMITTSFQQMLDTNVMMPLDLLSDEKYLYSIMPYCNGGELFELLNTNDRFTENEARYWMHQVLNGIEKLQHAGICHRDMSLENLLVHNNGALIIDMGMCLRIPYQHVHNNMTNTQYSTQQQNLSSSFNNMHIINTSTGISNTATPNLNDTMIDPYNAPEVPSVRNLRRYMMKPQGTCGKWHYMSPEIHNNNAPFDGYTVDMWAAGVILFLMLTGFPPWDRPASTDERFKYMSAGYLVQMLTEWEIGLSSDAMDLLQRMMFLDPKDRLSLDQVRAHPWMVNGPLQPPSN